MAALTPFTVCRVYADESGESHFSTFEIKMKDNGKTCAVCSEIISTYPNYSHYLG